MSSLSRNLAPLAVFLIVASLGWAFGGINGYLLPFFVPWLSLFALEVMLVFPQRHHWETHAEARLRVWSSLRRDPFVWVAVVFLVLLSIPFLNCGLCPQCDHLAIADGASAEPPVPFLPSCVNRLHHLNVVLWFLPALVSVLTLRHACTNSGRRLFVEMTVWNGVGMAALGFVQQLAGAPGPWWIPFRYDTIQFFSTFAYPNMAGDYFTTLFILAFAVWRRRIADVNRYEREMQDAYEEKRRSGHSRFWRRHYALIAMVILYFAALNTLSRSAIVLASAAAVVLFLHGSLTTMAAMQRVERVKFLAGNLLAAVAIVVSAMVFMPDSIRKELGSIDTIESLDRVTGRGEYHDKVAREILSEYPVFGCGGWGYMHIGTAKTPEKYRKTFGMPGGGIGAANVHNDYLQFLCEHGSVGLLMIASMLFLLIVPVARSWKDLANRIRFSRHSHLPPPRGFFVMPLPAFALLFAAAATMIHAFGDCPLRSPAILSLLLSLLAAVPGYIPSHHSSN